MTPWIALLLAGLMEVTWALGLSILMGARVCGFAQQLVRTAREAT
jgi:multidrug transporter EmrE-like cation transporter